jgi:hypothetical protein
MWTIPKSMTMITKMRILLMDMADRNHGPPSTIPRTGMRTKASHTGGTGKGITNTDTRKGMILWKRKMMICGDRWHTCSLSRCFHAFTMEFLGAFLLRGLDVLKGYAASVFLGGSGGHWSLEA